MSTRLADLLTPEEAQEVEAYRTGRLPFAKLSPTTRGALGVAKCAVDEIGKKQMPFGKPIDRQAMLDHIGIEDTKDIERIGAEMDTIDVTNGLLNRMGTDADRQVSDAPPTIQELLEAQIK
jgi:hypothetical protein